MTERQTITLDIDVRHLLSVAKTISTDTARPILCSVLVEYAPAGDGATELVATRFVATDSYTLTVIEIDAFAPLAAKGLNDRVGLLIDGALVKDIARKFPAKVLRDATNTDNAKLITVTLMDDGQQLTATETATGLLIAGSRSFRNSHGDNGAAYPNYQQLIPMRGVDADGNALDVLPRASTFNAQYLARLADVVAPYGKGRGKDVNYPGVKLVGANAEGPKANAWSFVIKDVAHGTFIIQTLRVADAS